MFDRGSEPQHALLLDETATLSDDQLDKVAGGAPSRTPAPPSAPPPTPTTPVIAIIAILIG